MNTPTNHTTRASHSGSVPAVQETSYLSCPEGRIGYDVAGDGSLVILVPGLGDLRAGYRFLAPALRAAGYRVACTDLRGHGDNDATFTSYGDEETAGDVIALLEEGMHDRHFPARTRRSPAQIPSRRCASARHRLAEMIGRLLLSGAVNG